MPRSINDMIVEVGRLRNRLERDIVEGQAAKSLSDIFDAAERGLGEQQRLFRSLDVTASGRVVRSVKNVETAGKIAEDLRVEIDEWIVGPGRRWADRAVPIVQDAGRQLARMNLDVEFVSQDMIDEIFDHVPRAERAALKVGKGELYRIMGTVGDDVQDWFRNELLDSVVNGLPVQGAGSLAQRLFESGRLKPIVVRTEKGRLIRRSLRQRANAIARVESAKIMNAVHDSIAQRALGSDRVAKNSNPQDSRTTNICSRASRQPVMTRDEWIASPFGLPPRLRGPFHWCRSVMIWGERSWFEDEEEGAKPRPKKPPKKRPPRKRREPEPTPLAKADAADIALMADASRPVQDRVAAYGRVRGDAKIAQIKALERYQGRRLKELQAEKAAIDADQSRINRRSDALWREQEAIETPEVKSQYPVLSERRRAFPRLQELADEYELLSDQATENVVKINRLEQEIRIGAGRDVRDRVAAVLAQPGDAIKARVPRPSKQGARESAREFQRRIEAADAIEEGRDFLNTIMAPTATTTGKAFAVDVKMGTGSRAFARKGGVPKSRRRPRQRAGESYESWSARVEEAYDRPAEISNHEVHLSKRKAGIGATGTAVHEFGHTIEYATGAGGFSAEFIKYRVGSGPMRTMKSWGFTGYNKRADLIRKNNPDRFEDVMAWAEEKAKEMATYTGGIYGHGTTELISMGLEALWRDPIGFVTKDPEFARFLFGVLDGSYKVD